MCKIKIEEFESFYSWINYQYRNNIFSTRWNIYPILSREKFTIIIKEFHVISI